MALACELSGGPFRKCSKPAVGICKWCGKAFCSHHQSTFASKHYVCSSKDCSTKAAFTAIAGSAKERAQAHNREGLCGHPTCASSLPGANCCICSAEYCPTHLSARTFRVPKPAKTGDGDTKREYGKVRHFVCDQCLGLVDRYGAIELPIELDV